MNVLLGPIYLLQHVVEELLCRSINIHNIVVGRQSKVLTGKKLNEFLVTLRQLQRMMPTTLNHRLAHQFVETVTGNITLFSYILTKKEIKNEPNNRNKSQHKQPRHRFHGLAFLHHYDYHRRDDNQDVENNIPLFLCHRRYVDIELLHGKRFTKKVDFIDRKTL